jgi:hypothetical protein
MSNQNLVGSTFALYGCKAWAEPDNSETTISGLYMVEDLVYADRTCGQAESGYLVFPAERAGTGDGPVYFVDSDTFMEQTKPKSYGRRLVEEREMEFMAERIDKELAGLFDRGEHGGDIPF